MPMNPPDQRLLRRSLALSAFACIIGVAYVPLARWADPASLTEFPGLWVLPLFYSLPWLFIAPAFLLGLRKAWQQALRARRLAFGAAAAAGACVLHAAFIGLMASLNPVILDYVDAPSSRGLPVRLMLGEGFLALDLLLCVAVMAADASGIMRRELRRKDEELYQLSRHLTDSKLQSLKLQLNPHFLFNTLNGLAVLIDKRDNERAREMLGELSGFLRQTIRNPKEKWVTLEKELEFVRQYLRIEQYRFGPRLVCFEECEPLALTARIPPLLLQPLFENAIVHGLADKQGECRLGFECRLYDRYLIIMIFDNGDDFVQPKDGQRQGGGIGLSNVHARLREVYGENYSLSLEKKPDGTQVTLKLPAFKDSQF